MWRAKIVSLILLVVLLQVTVSCSAPEEQPPAIPTVDQPVMAVERPAQTAENKAAQAELLAKWLEAAKGATDLAAVLDETALIAQDMSRLVGGAPPQLLDVMADVAHTPEVRVLASMSLRSVQDTGIIQRLIDLTAADRDALTRSCAVELLVYYRGAMVDEALEALQHDAERRVQLSALCGLAMRDPAKRSRLIEFWGKPDATGEEKGRIVMTLADGSASESLDFFVGAAGDTSIAVPARSVAIAVVGQEGGMAHLAAMKALVTNDPDDVIRQAALDAMAQIETHEKQRAAPAGSGS